MTAIAARPHVIRCAHCRQSHGSVAEVRACAARGYVQHQRSHPAAPWEGHTETEVRRPVPGGQRWNTDQNGNRPPVTEAGIYLGPDGNVYKVQIAVHGSGFPYAKMLQGTSFVHAPGAIRRLSSVDKMTLDQARAYGRVYGVCCRCGATLTDEDSIAAGIGPICATKF